MKAEIGGAAIRALLQGDGCVHPASIYDPLSARIAEELGYELGMLAGSTASLTVLGEPDEAVITLTELAEQVRRITRAASIPLLVDADHGYGNALNVRRTVEELEASGASALTIEDTDLPRRFGAGAQNGLISLAEGVGKMRAALAARTDPNTIIVGRTSAVAIKGVGEAIARARAYEDAGVDAIFLAGVSQPAQLDEISQALGRPLILGNPGAALLDASFLASRGVRICLLGHAPLLAAVQSVHDTLKALRSGTRPSELPGLASGSLMDHLSRRADVAEGVRRFLT